MVLFLEETKIEGLRSSFNIVIENQYLEPLLLEETGFTDSTMRGDKQTGYGIIYKCGASFSTSLTLREINSSQNIFSVTWNPTSPSIRPFQTYNYIPDMDLFNREKRGYEKHFDVVFSEIESVETKDAARHMHSDYEKAAIQIMKEQKRPLAPGVIYALFGDVLGPQKTQTLRKIAFI